MPVPTNVKSNIWNGAPISCSRTRDTMIFGDVPISVTIPPSNAANDIGISSADTDVPCLRAS